MNRARTPGFTLGFTLIELMVTLAILSIVLVAIGGVFMTQIRMYQSHSNRRTAQASARQAIAFVEQKVRDVGYGVDPGRALIAFDSYDPATNAQGVNFPDAVATHARDTLFSRRITGIDSGSGQITFTPPLTDPLRQGQILLALCAGGRTYAFVTASATAGAGSGAVSYFVAAPPVESPVGAPGALFNQALAMTGPCLGDGSGVLTRVDRYAFYINAFDDDRDNATPDMPYLMLHRGLDLNGDNRVDASDATPVAPGIEQLQVAYILNTTDASEPTIVGVTSAPGYGGAWEASSTGPTFGQGHDHPSRLLNHPSNIRQVRLTLVARSTRPDHDKLGDTAANSLSGTALSSGAVPWKDLENLALPVGNPAFDPTGRGYPRTVLRVSVAPKNLLMRAQFLPPTVNGG